MNRRLILNNLLSLNQLLGTQVGKIQNFPLKTPIIQSKRTFKIENDKQTLTQEDQVKEQKKRNEEVQDMTELIRDFLDPAEFYKSVQTISDIDFFCGVPDSLLKDFCAYISTNVKKEKHIITSNEGAAIAMAAGYHLATGKSPMVYLQNSGLGNIVNPVMSLAVPAVYSIPMLLLIGWRGEPGKRDEPQHRVQGQSTPGILAALGIPFQTLPDYQEGAEQALLTAKQYMTNAKGPYCLLVRRQTFLPFKFQRPPPRYTFNREDALKIVIDELDGRDIVVGTTGMLSRELFEYREVKKHGHEKDFLTVGSMGHASAIAMGIAMNKSKRQVFCLDGDGSVIMHMGTLATIGQNGPENLKHIIFNNGAHDSVGGQPTDADNENFSFAKIALGCGYKEAFEVHKEDDIREGIKRVRESKGPILMEIKCNPGHRKNLGRPTRKPIENKSDFMHFLAIN
ncbi:unnamed protein product [Brachionus calyciflorus]|uniref:IlvB-like protein n=1 Tax=Brachionus calyciflorus TaxID=104777 RepID=A0A813T9Q1_9BILA|nr:unnamed protein product [Brachionus calyciflorus]